MSYVERLLIIMAENRVTKCKLQTAKNVLNDLYEIKENKKLPFLTIRRAIKLQKGLIERYEKELKS